MGWRIYTLPGLLRYPPSTWSGALRNHKTEEWLKSLVSPILAEEGDSGQPSSSDERELNSEAHGWSPRTVCEGLLHVRPEHENTVLSSLSR